MTVLEDNLEDDQENIKNKAHHLEVVQVLNRKKEKAINKENIAFFSYDKRIVNPKNAPFIKDGVLISDFIFPDGNNSNFIVFSVVSFFITSFCFFLKKSNIPIIIYL